MNIPDILLRTPHLPLLESTTSEQAVALANTFYQTSLVAGDFKATQAFISSVGHLALELVDAQTGKVVVTFENYAFQAPTEKETLWGTPASVFMGDPVLVSDASELDFLDNLVVGASASDVWLSHIAHDLAQLLNCYQFMPTWHSGTLAQRTTGGFKLVYKGPTKNLPGSLYGVPPSPMIAIIEITHGKQLGHVCLRT
jgi:hypothetical protein